MIVTARENYCDGFVALEGVFKEASIGARRTFE